MPADHDYVTRASGDPLYGRCRECGGDFESHFDEIEEFNAVDLSERDITLDPVLDQPPAQKVWPHTLHSIPDGPCCPWMLSDPNPGMELVEMSDDGKTALVLVDCPECGDVNREARRKCGTCNHTGKVKKIVPVAPIEEKPSA